MYSLIIISVQCKSNLIAEYREHQPDKFICRNWTRYPISERDFRQSYASICSNGTAAHPNDVRFLPLLFVILAIAVRLAPEHVAGDARTRRLTSLRYYWSCE